MPYYESQLPVALGNDLAYFVAADPIGGLELWSTDGTSDGTSDGTVRAVDLTPGSEGSFPSIRLLNDESGNKLGAVVEFTEGRQSGEPNRGLLLLKAGEAPRI